MVKADEAVREIREPGRQDLLLLWEKIKTRKETGWQEGKAFEYLILRAFELEGAIVRWPYTVELFEENVEQIDGVIHMVNSNLSFLVECKDQQTPVNIEPIAKLRNQILRRPSGTIGAIFTTKSFTTAALTLARFVPPQTILLWEANNITFCLERAKFIEGMLLKYRRTIEEGVPDFDITNHKIWQMKSEVKEHAKVIIVTEGEFDTKVLKALLNREEASQFEILEASGFSSALSKAHSLLTQIENPIILLLDTNTTDNDEIEEKKDFVDFYISSKRYDNFKTVWAVPELEVIFLDNKNLLKKATGQDISNEVIEISKANPKNALEILTKNKRDKLLTMLDSEDVNELRKSKIITEIIDFGKRAAV